MSLSARSVVGRQFGIELVVLDRDFQAVAEALQIFERELLHLVCGVASLEVRAQGPALDGLGKNDGWLPLVDAIQRRQRQRHRRARHVAPGHPRRAPRRPAHRRRRRRHAGDGRADRGSRRQLDPQPARRRRAAAQAEERPAARRGEARSSPSPSHRRRRTCSTPRPARGSELAPSRTPITSEP